MPNVFILLGTYQGDAYLADLLASIRRQSRPDWTLLVRDDGSDDATRELLRQAAAADGRIVLLESSTRLGPAGNYGLLMQEALRRGAQYQFFADQDDVWLADKLEKQMRRMEESETAAGPHRAHLVYSDLVVTDDQMRVLDPSFLASTRLRHGEGQPLATLLGRNFVPGCAAALNRPLVELALPVPSQAVQYDWWVALCAAAAGHISYIPEPLVQYRRHAGAFTGPTNFWTRLNPLRYSWKEQWRRGFENFRRSLEQARALRDRMEQWNTGCGDSLELLKQFCEIFEQPGRPWRRIAALHRLGVPAIDRPRRVLYEVCVWAETMCNRGAR